MTPILVQLPSSYATPYIMDLGPPLPVSFVIPFLLGNWTCTIFLNSIACVGGGLLKVSIVVVVVVAGVEIDPDFIDVISDLVAARRK
jgi:hypothetical protein